MVNAAPERIQRDAEDYFKTNRVPESLAFVSRLSPLHQRLFAHELWQAAARVAMSMAPDALEDLVELVEAWEATADLDADPDRLRQIEAPKEYRELAL